MIKLIVLLIAGYFIYRFLKDYMNPREEDTISENTGESDETVVDPVCRSYIPLDSALRVRNGDKVHYFCSEECRQKFIGSLREGKTTFM